MVQINKFLLFVGILVVYNPNPLVVVDNMQSGEGDLVAYVTGREGSLILDDNFTPVDAGIVAIVDSVNTEEQP